MCTPISKQKFFFFNDTATTEIYTLSLHDALPISRRHGAAALRSDARAGGRLHRAHPAPHPAQPDRKSTRLNSSHGYISYAVFCLKKKKAKCLQILFEVQAHHIRHGLVRTRHPTCI